MSNAADEFGFYADQLLKKSKTNTLRERMQRFVDEHDTDGDLKTARQHSTDGTSLSETVIEDRDERF